MSKLQRWQSEPLTWYYHEVIEIIFDHLSVDSCFDQIIPGDDLSNENSLH